MEDIADDDDDDVDEEVEDTLLDKETLAMLGCPVVDVGLLVEAVVPLVAEQCVVGVVDDDDDDCVGVGVPQGVGVVQGVRRPSAGR